MATSIDNNELTADGTEQTIDTIASDGSFVIGIDMTNLALGDEVVIKVKVKVRSVGTTRLAYQATYVNNQTIPVKFSIPVVSTNEVVFTLEQTAGTNRAFPWETWSL